MPPEMSPNPFIPADSGGLGRCNNNDDDTLLLLLAIFLLPLFISQAMHAGLQCKTRGRAQIGQ